MLYACKKCSRLHQGSKFKHLAVTAAGCCSANKSWPLTIVSLYKLIKLLHIFRIHCMSADPWGHVQVCQAPFTVSDWFEKPPEGASLGLRSNATIPDLYLRLVHLPYTLFDYWHILLFAPKLQSITDIPSSLSSSVIKTVAELVLTTMAISCTERLREKDSGISPSNSSSSRILMVIHCSDVFGASPGKCTMRGMTSR